MIYPAFSKSLVSDRVIELEGRYEVVVLYQRHRTCCHIGIASLYFASTLYRELIAFYPLTSPRRNGLLCYKHRKLKHTRRGCCWGGNYKRSAVLRCAELEFAL